jgi:hypothetical protein
LRASLRTADVGRVYVFSEPGRPDYVQVSVDGVLLVRFKSLEAAAEVAEHTRPIYRIGNRVQRTERACNVLIYNLRGEKSGARAAAERIRRALRHRCA